MQVGAETHDFGIEMNVGNHISMVEKMDSSESFWNLTFEQFAPENEINFDLKLVVNPIKIIYDATFVEEITNFFTT